MGDALRLAAKLSVPVFIVSSMLAMGLSLTPRAIIAPLRSPRLVVAALLVNFVLAPGAAYLLTVMIPLERSYAVGLLLLSIAAGAPFLPTLAEAAHTDLPLSVALMALLTAGTILFMPFALPVLVRGFQASPWTIARPLVVLMVLPLLVAMIIRHVAARLSDACRPVMKVIANASLVVLVVLLIGLNLGALWGVVGSGAIAVSALFVAVLFAAGFMLGGPSWDGKGVLGLGSAARNVGAALPVASVQPDSKVIVMLLVGTLAGLVLCLVAARFLRRRRPPDPRSLDKLAGAGIATTHDAGLTDQ
jgi:bile acid:Na+ symporter, BASS family